MEARKSLMEMMAQCLPGRHMLGSTGANQCLQKAHLLKQRKKAHWLLLMGMGLVLALKRRRRRKLMTKCLTGGETHLKKAKGGKKTKRKAKAEAGLGKQERSA